jgi:hypothetical protein
MSHRASRLSWSITAFVAMLGLVGPGAGMAQPPAPAPAIPPVAPIPPAGPAANPDPASQAQPAAGSGQTAALSAAVFPRAVAAKYASQKPGKARLHTCLDQYHANKAAGGNGGLKWIQKGGGYYSQCLKKLKT